MGNYVVYIDKENVEYVIRRVDGDNRSGQFFIECEQRVNPNDGSFIRWNVGFLLAEGLKGHGELETLLKNDMGSHPNP